MILPNFQQLQDKNLENKIREQINTLKINQNKEQVDLFRMTHTGFGIDTLFGIETLSECDDNFDKLKSDIDNRYENMIAALRGKVTSTDFDNEDWLERVIKENVLITEKNAKWEVVNVSNFGILFKF